MYRYSSQKHNASLLLMGSLRIGTLHDFRRKEHKRGIVDFTEGRKRVMHKIDQLYIPDSEDPAIKSNRDFQALQAFHAVEIKNSRNITLKDVSISQNFDAPNTFILCTSKTCSTATMRQFEGADSCVEIIAPTAFYKLLTETLNSIIPVIFRGVHEVQYQDRQETWNGKNWGLHPSLIKETAYKPQAELRAIWEPRFNQNISPIILCNYKLGAYCRNRDLVPIAA